MDQMIDTVRSPKSRAGDLLYGSLCRSKHFYHRVRCDDVYLVSFPRSGNTYARFMLTALLVGHAPSAQDVAATIPDIYWQSNRIRPRTLRRVMAKSHGPMYPLVAKIVYIVRDGREALLSYYYRLAAGGAVHPQDVADMLLWDKPWPCTWAEHVRGWLSYLDSAGIGMVIRYEDLVRDPVQELGKIAAFLELHKSEGALAAAVENSTKSKMAAAEERTNKGSLGFVGITPTRWQEIFSREDVRKFENRHAEILRRLGYPTTPE